MTPRSDPSPTRRLIGGLLMAVGGLIAVLSGVCTGYVQVVFLLDWRHAPPPGPDNHELHFPPWLPLLFGAVPILVGVGLFFCGRWLFRSATPSSVVPEPSP